MTAKKKRLVFTDGLKNPFAMQQYEDGVYAIIGPLENFTSDPEFQDELQALCLKYNRENEFVSKKKYAEIMRSIEARRS